jgi:Tfp pilus assembly protein PilF
MLGAVRLIPPRAQEGRMHRRRSLVTCVAPALCVALFGCAAAPRADVIQIQDQHNRVLALQHHRAGVRWLDKDQLEKASSAFQKAVSADEDFAAAHNNLGAIALQKGDLYQAAWSFQKAIELEPELPDPHNNLGLTWEAANRIDDALMEFEMASELDSTCAEYLANLIRARQRRGDQDDFLQEQLRQLLLLETRPEWREWAEEQLMLLSRPPAATPPIGLDSGGAPAANSALAPSSGWPERPRNGIPRQAVPLQPNESEAAPEPEELPRFERGSMSAPQLDQHEPELPLPFRSPVTPPGTQVPGTHMPETGQFGGSQTESAADDAQEFPAAEQRVVLPWSEEALLRSAAQGGAKIRDPSIGRARVRLFDGYRTAPSAAAP